MMATYVNNCIFCKIAKDEMPAEKVYEDDDVMCIKDIKPAAKHHYLIIPKNHIPTVKDLKPDDEPLFDKLIDTAKLICQQQGIDLDSARSGFTWPPFNSVGHVHLHVIAPLQDIGFFRRLMYVPGSAWFVTIDYVKARFRTSG